MTCMTLFNLTQTQNQTWLVKNWTHICTEKKILQLKKYPGNTYYYCILVWF